MSFTLGFQPERLTVKLPRFGDFVAALVAPTDDGWPLGTEIELRFYANDDDEDADVTWPVTIVGQRAEWHVNEAAVHAVRAAGLETARIFYSSPDTELEWAVGVTRDVN